MRRETDLSETDVDLITPGFLTRPPGSGDNPDSNPQSIQSLVSSWSQLDSGTNSRLEELRVVDDEEEEMLPCQGSSEEDSDKNEKVSETALETCDNDIRNCDNNGDIEDNADKENFSPEGEDDDEEADAGSEAKTGKKKNKKRRKHAKKKPKGVTITTAETIEVA